MADLRALLLDPAEPNSLPARARQRRWTALLEQFPRLPDMRVLDLGGSLTFWINAPVRPEHVTVVNTDAGAFASAHEIPWMTAAVGDACQRVPGDFDLVISNSLLEHVGGHERRAMLAEVINNSAPHHWIQTPYRYFPVEPHWGFPGMQWLPFRARVAVSRRWPLGHIRSGNRLSAIADVASVELLSATEMRAYFPHSTLWFERWMGLPKSMVAIR